MVFFKSLTLLATVTASANAAAACGDAADQNVYNTKGKANFVTDMTTCGKKCFGAKSCVSTCMVGKEGYSKACADCFGELGACTEANCLAPCIAGPSPKCTTCQNAKCVPGFKTCSGLEPPPPTRTILTVTSDAHCCDSCNATAGLVKYYSVAKNPEAHRQQCGESCMNPKDFNKYHFFEHNLTKATSNTPCKSFGFTQYIETDTHGFGPVKATLDMYKFPGNVATKATPSASCKSTPKVCSGTCKIEEPAPKKGSDLHIDVTGSCATEAVTGATYDIKIVFGGLPILNKKGQDATKDNNFNLPLNMGSVEIAAVKFPVAAGQKLLLPGIAHIGKLAPAGKLVATVDAYDQDKKALFSFEIDITL